MFLLIVLLLLLSLTAAANPGNVTSIRRRINEKEFEIPKGPYITADASSEVVVIPEPPLRTIVEEERSNCPHLDGEDLLDWHNDSTWGNDDGVPRQDGVNVVLPPHSRVIVRKSISSVFGIISIPSTSELLFDENTNGGISLQAHGFDVRGQLTMGSETCRLETPIEITLHGERPADAVTNIRLPSYKGISVNGGILNLHGKYYSKSWTRLAKTVQPGESIILLQHAVTWQPNQQILLVTTAIKDSREWHRNEIATIESVILNPVQGVGAAILLQNPVQYSHTAHAGAQGEVGLLSRNIRIQGYQGDSVPIDPDNLNCFSKAPIHGSDRRIPCPNTQLTGFGGHIIIHNGGKGFVEGVELLRMGQTNVLGRYPFHFHLLRDSCPNCYMRESSIHESYYRCVALHGTNGVELSQNIAFDITGSCFYLEDGVEERNRIEYNLAAHIHMILSGEPPRSSNQKIDPYVQTVNLTIPSDVAAAAFYIPNVHNTIIGNAASGGWSGFAFPNLPEPVGLHRHVRLRPQNQVALEIDGNTAHSSSWWWKHASPFYIGGLLYYNEEDDVLTYNAGRAWPKRDTCLANRCTKVGNRGCTEYSWCPPHVQAWLRITNSKSFLIPNIGFNSWNGRAEVVGYECHDCGLTLQALSTEGFYATNVLGVCRSKAVPLVLPEGVSGTDFMANGFQWYDTEQEHILTNITFRNCGYRSDEFNQYNQDANRGCGDDYEMGCSSQSSVWSLVTHSDTHAPEVMQATLGITHNNCGRVFAMRDFRNDAAKSSVSGRIQNWYDADGSITGLGVASVIASGLADAGMWWHVDDNVVFDSQGPLLFYPLTPGRGLGHVRLQWDSALHKDVGVVYCGNGAKLPCEAVGTIRHLGDLYENDPGLPVTATGDIAGPTGGFGWQLALEKGAPKSLRIEQMEVDPSSLLLLSIGYPLGTNFTITAHARYGSYCENNDVIQYPCQAIFYQVDSVDAVRTSLGNTYYVSEEGVLTLRIISLPKTHVGHPEFFFPTYETVGKWNRGYALGRFERDGIVLPKQEGAYVTIDADCISKDDVYCSEPALPAFSMQVCDDGFHQVGYDRCEQDPTPAPVTPSPTTMHPTFSPVLVMTTPIPSTLYPTDAPVLITPSPTTTLHPTLVPTVITLPSIPLLPTSTLYPTTLNQTTLHPTPLEGDQQTASVGLAAGAIVGIVVGSILGFGLLAALLLFGYYYKKHIQRINSGDDIVKKPPKTTHDTHGGECNFSTITMNTIDDEQLQQRSTFSFSPTTWHPYFSASEP